MHYRRISRAHHSVDGAIELRQGIQHHALQARDAIPRPAGHVLQMKRITGCLHLLQCFEKETGCTFCNNSCGS